MRLCFILVALFCLSFAVPTHASWVSRMMGGTNDSTASVSLAAPKPRLKLLSATPIAFTASATVPAALPAQSVASPTSVHSRAFADASSLIATLPASMPWADRAAAIIAAVPASMPWADRAVVFVAALPASMPWADRAAVLISTLPVSMPWSDRAAVLVAVLPASISWVDRAAVIVSTLPASMPWSDRAAVLVAALPAVMPWNDRAAVIVSTLPASMPWADRAAVFVAVLPASMSWNDRAVALITALPITQPTAQDAHPIVSDPFATLDDTHIWTVGVLGQLQRKILAARNRGDDTTYQTLLKQYWDIFSESQVRRESLKRKPISGAFRAINPVTNCTQKGTSS